MLSTKNENLISQNSPSALKALLGAFKFFFLAARPKTWSASICPVLIGAVIASLHCPINWTLLIYTLLFALFIQIGTNFANDYFDFMKNADTADRIGPKRAVQQGWIAPKTMLLSTGVIFLTALLFALPLMLKAGLWSFGAALLCVSFGILYTGGPKPLGYLGLGEVLVFLFFGPVSVMGTYFLQTMQISWEAFFASIPPGLLSAAILVANNLRDEKTDRLANKNTIVVRFGRMFGQFVFASCILISFVFSLLLSKVAAASLLLGIPLIKKVYVFKEPIELIGLLQRTSLLLLVYTLVFSLAMQW